MIQKPTKRPYWPHTDVFKTLNYWTTKITMNSTGYLSENSILSNKFVMKLQPYKQLAMILLILQLISLCKSSSVSLKCMRIQKVKDVYVWSVSLQKHPVNDTALVEQ
jgi:hypothetical protein